MGQDKLPQMSDLPIVDLASGILTGPGCISSTRTFRDVASIFANSTVGGEIDPETPIYTTHGLPDTHQPELLYATTMIQPGQVNGEYYMTRGHFHTRKDRGEFNITLSGRGAAILMSPDGEVTVEWMEPGSVHNFDGIKAHRIANIGGSPLVFLCVWMGDCGHDYETIAKKGFTKRLMCINGQPALL